MTRKRAGIAAAGALAVLVIAYTVLMPRLIHWPGGAPQVAPTQWIAKQTTELLGRAPTPSEWQGALSAFARSGCNQDTLTAWSRPVAFSAEFNSDYPEATSKESRVLALIRASLNQEPSAEAWSRFFAPYSRVSASWPQTVGSVYASPDFAAQVATVCNASVANYRFGAEPPLDVPVTGHGPRIQADLQKALDAAAAAGGGVVQLDPRAVIRIGGDANGNQGLHVPTGVTLTTSGSPKATRYADMARLVPTGRICAGTTCGHVSIVTVDGGQAGQPGGTLTNIWVDGKGTGSDNRDPRFNYQIADVESTSGSAIRVADNRLSDPPPGGAALRADGSGTRGGPCGGETITGNLITGYAGDHAQDRLGRGRWSDGVIVDCEDATVSENSVIDITGQGISMRGDYNRATARSTNQQSSVVHNMIISAGANAFVALGADQVGDCSLTAGNHRRLRTLAPLLDQRLTRPSAKGA